jgi:metal-responsive CopG/Arc/MetJ family transcriptional regulator
MKEEKITQISAKLNPELDKELIQGIKKIPKRERSHVYRVALKRYLREVGEWQ